MAASPISSLLGRLWSLRPFASSPGLSSLRRAAEPRTKIGTGDVEETCQNPYSGL